MKKLPIGNDKFRETRDQNYYYVDKTMLTADFGAYQIQAELSLEYNHFNEILKNSFQTVGIWTITGLIHHPRYG